MSCTIAEDKILFPHATAVVRVGTDQWSDHHTIIMEMLCEAVRNFLRTRAKLSFEQIVDEYRRNEPRAKVGDSWVYLLYGDDDAFFLDGELKMNIKGLVYERMRPCRNGRRGRGSKSARCVRA